MGNFFKRILCYLLILANLVYGVPISSAEVNQDSLSSPKLTQVERDINDQVSSYYRKQQNQLALSSQQLGLQGPLSLNVNYDGLTKKYFAGAKWTQLFNQISGFSVLGEYNPDRYRLGGTLAFQPMGALFLKASIEQLAEVLPFHFTQGNVNQLVRQNAYGAEAQYNFEDSLVQDLNAGIYYAKTPNVTLNTILIGPTLNLRNIAGATTWGGDIGTNLIVDPRTSIGAKLNYDKVLYNTIFNSSSSYNAAGLGGSVSLNRIISDTWMFSGKAETRKIYNDYSATVSWLPPVPSMLGLELSFTGQRTISHNQMPNSSTVGIGLKFNLGDNNAIDSHYQNVSRSHSDFNHFVSTPAVYMNQVLAFAEEVTHAASPIIHHLVPGSGPFEGGNTIQIIGQHFVPGTRVTFNDVESQRVDVVSATVINTIVPAITPTLMQAKVNKVTVKIITPDGKSYSLTEGYRYAMTKMAVSGISPNSGSQHGGIQVTISGSHFVEGLKVLFDKKEAQVVSVKANEIQVVTPAASKSGSVSVTVINPDSQQAVLADSYMYVSVATVLATLSPTRGSSLGGTSVTINGTGFESAGTTKVIFGGKAATNVKVVSATQITAKTPAHALGVVNVVVNNNGFIAQFVNGYTYVAGPSIKSISPNNGKLAAGTPITITGTNFLRGATVSIGGSAATVTAVTATSITATAPAHAAGKVDVVVRNTDSQSSTLSQGYTYNPRPTVTGVGPAVGALGGGTRITITGTGFLPGGAVTIRGLAATSISVVSATQITATTPANAAGQADVVVTNADTQSGTLVGGYTYHAGPVISSISPNTGVLAGGTTVTINGSGFMTGATVTFDGIPASSLSVVNANQILATTPQHAAGAVNVVLTNTDGQSVTSTNAYTYQAPLTVTSISPNIGGATGSSSVTITGSGFLSGATVTIGGSLASRIVVVSASQITAKTPAHLPGVVDVVVTNSDNQSGTLSNAYTYQLAPTITSITPSSGSTVGGNRITINGTGFIAGATVNFGSNPGTSVSVMNSTRIDVTVPSSSTAASVNVSVTNPDNQADSLLGGYSYFAPVVSSVSPSGGFVIGGTPVVITGNYFASGATVKFDTTSGVSPTVTDAQHITVTAPPHASGLVNVVVTNSDNKSGTLTNSFRYGNAPTITGISPVGGPLASGTPITITGTNFDTTGTPVVKIGGVAATAITVSSTTITATAPGGSAGLANVEVINPDTQAAVLIHGYRYGAAPTISSISPNGGPTAGSQVTIYGTGFDTRNTGTKVQFGLNPINIASNVTVISATQITAIAPAGLGRMNVLVINPDTQTSSGLNTYTYSGAPTVTSLSRVGGPLAGGTSLTITGSGFQNGATVKFGGSSATAVNVTNSTTITATPPSGTGTVAVQVTNPDSQSGTLAFAYRYASAPTVTGITPNGGPTGGATYVTITGTGFDNTMGSGLPTVKFGSNSATQVTFVNSTTLTARSPVHAAGVVNVVVTNPDTQAGTLMSGYTYGPAPTVTNVSPVGGDPSGGATVTLTGTGFLPGAVVKFGNTQVIPTSITSTSITVTSPSGTGEVVVKVINTDNQIGSWSGRYRYAGAPTLTSISPVGGPIAGGGSVTLTGTGFDTLGTPIVKFGSTAATNVQVLSSTQLSATVPNVGLLQSLQDVQVINPDTQQATLNSAYRYANAPTVTSLSPTSGALAGGTTVTITGTNFDDSMGTPTVTFGGAAATGVTVDSPTQITVTTPGHVAGGVDVVVTNADTQSGFKSSSYTYQAAPVVTSISPVGGATAGGTSITITGTGFLPGATVDLGGSAAMGVTVVNSTTITATSTGHVAATVDVVVTNPDNQSGTLSSGYRYAAAPAVTSVSLNAGALAGGTNVTITGTGFDDSMGAVTVTFGGNAASSVVVVNATTITATTPAHVAGAVNVVVTNADTQSGTGTGVYTYRAAPTLTSIDVVGGSVAGGTAVVLTGTGFVSGAIVTFGGTDANANDVSVDSPTQITVSSTPAHVAATVDVVVTNPDNQSGTLNSSYRYAGAPTVSSVSPSSGAAGGSTSVTITGTGFDDSMGAVTVTFGGNSATNVTVVDATTITATTPAHAAGGVNVVVTNPDSQTGTGTNAYTYQSALAAPTVTSVETSGGVFNGQAKGPATGGNDVFIYGSDFVNGATVTFGGVSPGTVLYLSSGVLLTLGLGEHAPGTVDVVVTNPDNQTGTLHNGYVYSGPTVTSAITQGGPYNGTNHGAAAGGDTVIITGTHFTGALTVTIGPTSATSFTVDSPTQITAQSGGALISSPLTVDVIVTDADGVSGKLIQGFTYEP